MTGAIDDLCVYFADQPLQQGGGPSCAHYRQTPVQDGPSQTVQTYEEHPSL